MLVSGNNNTLLLRNHVFAELNKILFMHKILQLKLYLQIAPLVKKTLLHKSDQGVSPKK